MVLLTCNRPQYVLLALRQIALQDYPALEALVVHDGTAPLAPLLRAAYPALDVLPPPASSATSPLPPPPQLPPAVGATSDSPASPAGLAVRLLTLPRRASIGEKRAIASRAARGEVIVHWEDDNFFAPSRISAQIAPIARGTAAITALELSHMVAMPSTEVYATPPGQRGPLFTSLAYRASLGRALSFANISLGGDRHFAERAVQARSAFSATPLWSSASPTPTASTCSICCARGAPIPPRRRRGSRLTF